MSATELMAPLLPTYARTDVSFVEGKGCVLTEAVALGYGPFEGYGFHTLEGLQCMVERRKGGETGIEWVQMPGRTGGVELERGESPGA